MELTKEQKRGAELIKTLAEKAWESASFKDQLINSPKAAIESITGNKIDGNIKVLVEDQTDSNFVYLNIPRKLDLENLELTDEQLEIVSGGEVGLTVAGIAIFAIGVYLGYNQK